MASGRRYAVQVIWDALVRTGAELGEEMSKRRMAKVEKFYDELEQELNSRGEEIVDEPSYTLDVDAWLVGEEPDREAS